MGRNVAISTTGQRGWTKGVGLPGRCTGLRISNLGARELSLQQETHPWVRTIALPGPGFSSLRSSHGRWLTWALTSEACASLFLLSLPLLPSLTSTSRTLSSTHVPGPAPGTAEAKVSTSSILPRSADSLQERIMDPQTNNYHGVR